MAASTPDVCACYGGVLSSPVAGETVFCRCHGMTVTRPRALEAGGLYPPPGFVFLTDADGAFVTTADGHFLVERA